MKRFHSDQDSPDDINPDNLREHGRDLAIDALLRLRSEKGIRVTPVWKSKVKYPVVMTLAALIILFCLPTALLMLHFMKDTRATNVTASRVLDMQIVEIKGTAHRVDSDGVEQQLERGELIMPLESVSVDEGSSVIMSLYDQSTLHVAGGSLITNRNTSDSKVIFLVRGDAVVHASPQAPNERLEVHTRDAFMEVVGTRFEVVASEVQTELVVEEGLVEVGHLTENNKSLERHKISPDLVAEIDPESLYIMKNDESEPEILSFSIIDVETRLGVDGYDPIQNKQIISLRQLPQNFNIKANTKGKIHSLAWISNQTGHAKNFEKVYPYTLAADTVSKKGGSFGVVTIDNNHMNLKATAMNRKGDSLHSMSLSVTFAP